MVPSSTSRPPERVSQQAMRIGFLTLPFPGHLNPMTALARKLKERGHEIVFFGIPDAEPEIRNPPAAPRRTHDEQG